jgi:CheY-like chemotaxis protein
MDHGSIGRALRQAFSAEVEPAETHDQALKLLREQPGRYALVLVNRVSDRDREPGVELIRALRADPDLARLPVMLVSNFAQAQAEAQAAGALPGFGKAELATARSIAELSTVLQPRGDVSASG